MKIPKATVTAVPAVAVAYPTAGGSYIGNDLTGELIRVDPVVADAAEPAPTETNPEEQI